MKKDNSHNSQLTKNITDKKYDEQITIDQGKFGSNIVEKHERERRFSFRSVDKEMQKTVNQVIDSFLKQRNTIILAKLAKENLFPQDTKHNQQFFTHLQHENPLINKSIDEINHYFCNQISAHVVKKIVSYLKGNELSAKVVTTSIIIENTLCGYNFCGMCFWDNVTDGQMKVMRKVPSLGTIKQNNQSSSSPSNMMVQQSVQSIKDQIQNQRESLLIVTVYLLKYEQSFRGNN